MSTTGRFGSLDVRHMCARHTHPGAGRELRDKHRGLSEDGIDEELDVHTLTLTNPRNESVLWIFTAPWPVRLATTNTRHKSGCPGMGRTDVENGALSEFISRLTGNAPRFSALRSA